MEKVSRLARVVSEPTCDGARVDVTFLVDTSASVTDPQLHTFKRIIVDLTSGVRVAQSGVRVAVATLNAKFNVLAHLATATDSEHLSAILDTLNFSGDDSTQAAEALDEFRDRMLKEGDRGHKRLLVVMSDGAFDRPERAQQDAEAVRRVGTQIFAVGFTQEMKRDVLVNLTGGPDRVFQIDGDNPDDDSHWKLVGNLRKLVCSG